MFVVVRVPLAVGFNNDILHCVRCRVQDVTKVPVVAVNVRSGKRKSFDLPIKYQLLRFQYFLTDRAEPCSRLFHHAVPRCRIKALRVYAFLRPGREADASVAQLFTEGIRPLSPNERREDLQDISVTFFVPQR